MERKISFDLSVKSVITVAFALILFALLFYIRDILVLFLISFVLATALEPLIDWLQRKKIPRIISMVGIYGLFVLLIYTIVRLVIPPITDQVNNIIQNRQSIWESISHYFSYLPLNFQTAIVDYVNNLPSHIGDFTSGSLMSNVFGVFNGLLGILTVLVASFYLLLEKNVMENAIKSYWPASSEEKALAIFEKIVQKISFWARGQIILSTSVGVLAYIGLTLLKFPYALIMAIVAGFMDLFPFIGPIITMTLGVILAFSISPISALWVFVLLLGIQQFEANILVPQVMKRATGLSPVLIIFALLIGAKLLGVVGVLIAVPIASATVVTIESLNKKSLSKEAEGK